MGLCRSVQRRYANDSKNKALWTKKAKERSCNKLRHIRKRRTVRVCVRDSRTGYVQQGWDNSMNFVVHQRSQFHPQI